MVELVFADGGLSAPCSFSSIRPATTKSRSIYFEDKARGLEVVSVLSQQASPDHQAGLARPSLRNA